jgi:hypothetical protein
MVHATQQVRYDLPLDGMTIGADFYSQFGGSLTDGNGSTAGP